MAIRFVDDAPAKRKIKPTKTEATKASPKRGRPRIEDRDTTLEAQKPWEALKMSRRTWYRRQKEKRE